MYFSPRPDGLAALALEAEQAGLPVRLGPERLEIYTGALSLHVAHESTPQAVKLRLERTYTSLVMLDLRPADGLSFEARSRTAKELLDLVDHADDVEARYGFHRIVALVSDLDGPAVDDLLLDLGARGIRLVRRESAGASSDPGFAGRALMDACRVIRDRNVGKTALCLSGGGITGIYFELGVLKCLQDCLPEDALSGVDMYFGISAGAVVSSTLAVGYSVDEFMAAVAGVPGTRMPELNLNLLRWMHLNHGDMTRRVRRTLASSARAVFAALRLKQPVRAPNLFFDYPDLIGPLFHSYAFETLLKRVLEAPGATNQFADLDNELYIGASDQDARAHVIFGTREHRDLPISKAVQASLSFNPAFSAVEIDGHYYEDGAVTRTSNFVEAIDRGATLVLIIDPFVPYVSKEVGGHIDRGLFYHMDQNVRTISFTRFENARNWVLRRHPEVSSYTFLPSNRQRRLLSINPMDHRAYLQIWRGAYLSTLSRIEILEHRMRGDMGAHGLRLDLSRARAVALRLEASEEPKFEDFFPDGQIQLQQPPLVMGPQPRPYDRAA